MTIGIIEEIEKKCEQLVIPETGNYPKYIQLCCGAIHTTLNYCQTYKYICDLNLENNQTGEYKKLFIFGGVGHGMTPEWYQNEQKKRMKQFLDAAISCFCEAEKYHYRISRGTGYGFTTTTKKDLLSQMAEDNHPKI